MTRRFDRIGWAYAQTQTSMPQRFVLVILADASAEHDGTCFLSHSTIAERTGMGISTVRDAVRALTEMGLLDATPRYMENGKQTSNIYRLGCYDEDGLVGVSGADTLPGADTTPARSRQDVEPTTRTSRKNNSQTSSGSRSSRHASRARDDSAWDDPAAAVFAKEQEPDDSESGSRPRTARNHGPDTAWALNGYYRQAVFVAGTGRVGNTNDGAMRKFFAEARRCGVKPATLRTMVDCFVEDPQLFNRTRTHRWKTFIANAPLLQERADNIIGQTPMEPGKEQFGGAIPKKVLDEILAEAG